MNNFHCITKRNVLKKVPCIMKVLAFHKNTSTKIAQTVSLLKLPNIYKYYTQHTFVNLNVKCLEVMHKPDKGLL